MRPGSVLIYSALMATCPVPVANAGPGLPGDPVAFSDLPGFASDNLAAAFQTFRASCAAHAGKPSRGVAAPPAALKAVCNRALTLPAKLGVEAAQTFFEHQFRPFRVGGDGFVTGYFEPVVDGSLDRTATYATPLFPRPHYLARVVPGRRPASLDPSLSAARRLPDGTLAPMPDRAAIEAGALGNLAPLVYVRDPVEAFFIQVQGSARIRLPDGSLRRLVFDGRNGYPYTSIGKILVQELGIPPAQMGLSQLTAWIRAHGQRSGDAGAALMQRNRSYIFFRLDSALPSHAGPIGGEGISLTPFRSLAIDRSFWAYGIPFYVDATLPWRGAEASPFQRLMVAQDTGSAIVGRARGDIFFGSGAKAGRLAGPIRHPASFFVLWPKAEAKPDGNRTP